MELVNHLVMGFGIAATPANLFFAFAGAVIGTLFGVLPGIGPIATIAMLLPLTFHLEPTSGLIMLAGIFYGAQYGGSTTAILVNLPGETSSVVTCIDGHQMARQGRAGAALAIAALGSFFAGCVSTALIAAASPPLAKVGQSFGATDYFSLMLPGGGATLSSFAAYVFEKKIARDPSRFGKGAIEGVAGPESANNAGAQTSFIPMLTLGIPGNAVMALMIGALTIHGIQPGPQVMTERPSLFWGMVASMWIGNLMLVVINLPLIGIWVQLLKVPYRLLYLAILLFCAIGVYTIGNSPFAVLLAAFFGVLGYIFVQLECEPAPMILGFVLGPLMEDNLRRAMRISSGDPMIFVNRPISLGLLIAAAILVAIVALPAIRSKRDEAFQEG